MMVSRTRALSGRNAALAESTQVSGIPALSRSRARMGPFLATGPLVAERARVSRHPYAKLPHERAHGLGRPHSPPARRSSAKSDAAS